MRNLFIAPILLLSALMSGCVTSPLNAPGSEQNNAAQRFEAPTGGAAIYVYRDPEFDELRGFAMTLDVNETEVMTFPGCYIRIETQPGSYLLESSHPDLLADTQDVSVTMAVGDVKVYEFQPISRIIISGETKLIERQVSETKSLIQRKKLCNLQTLNL